MARRGLGQEEEQEGEHLGIRAMVDRAEREGKKGILSCRIPQRIGTREVQRQEHRFWYWRN